MISIVLLQNIVDGQSLGPECGVGFAVHIAAGGIRGAVSAIAAHTENADAGQPLQMRCCGQSKLLISPALAVTGELDHGLTAGQEGQLLPLPGMGPENGTKEAARLFGLAAQLIRQKDRSIAQFFTFSTCCGAEFPDGAGDLGGDVVQHLWGFRVQACLGLGGQTQVIFFRDGQGLVTGGAVRNGGAGGNHIQRVTQNIGQHNGEHPGRGTELGKPAALDRGEPLADGIDLHNVCPAGQQLRCNILELLSADLGFFKQGAAAAGQQEQHRVLPGQAGDQVDGGLGGCEGVFVGDGMPRLPAVDLPQGALHMVVFGNDDALLNPVAQAVPGGLCHVPGSLACRNQDHPAREGSTLQRPGYRIVRLHSPDGGSNDLICVGTHCRIHS